MIVTTELHHACTNTHNGTSASAPLAAGIVALTLEANPDLTWRDLQPRQPNSFQHIVIRAAKPINLRAGDWVINGVGRNVSHSFDYGLMDAGAMVQLARNWTTAPEQHKCRQFYPSRFNGCAGSPDEQVVHLEHVQAIITLKVPKRGDIQIYLTSPSGTRSTLLTKRDRDTSRAGFIEWAFMTTHSWAELAAGLWTLEVDKDGMGRRRAREVGPGDVRHRGRDNAVRRRSQLGPDGAVLGPHRGGPQGGRAARGLPLAALWP
ncbi:convertase P-domain protein [Oesophagostomum dentatum]|uniref:Convertase P-domain protein n=1 Tax=Oesophagostomum dentatum TaxID=61180 RepID=A0A0B1TKC1_OESDE|nr:convertase P-domain protein [Oesophagostomum dentatum]